MDVRDRTVGVVGAGMMGAAVAQVFAEVGARVLLLDIDDATLDNAMQRIRHGLREIRLLSPNVSRDEISAVMSRIEPTTRHDKFANADLVIENVSEHLAVKERVHAWLDTTVPADAIIAVNTSAIEVARFAAWHSLPQRIVGVHFMNPVAMKHTVEVIAGRETSATVLDKTRGWLQQLGKRAIVVRDAPGFVSNRVLMLTINEAISLVEEGVSTARDVDDIFVSCFAHRMGPLRTADLIGLDTILATLEILQQTRPDGHRFRPSDLLVDMVGRGLLGQKCGRGFFEHPVF
jgi:3-hydroxybutyryl-CoA dehydrogenase